MINRGRVFRDCLISKPMGNDVIYERTIPHHTVNVCACGRKTYEERNHSDIEF